MRRSAAARLLGSWARIPLKTSTFDSLDAFIKLLKATTSFVTSVRVSVRLSVRPHGTTLLQLDGFLLNLIFQYFSEIYRENPSFIKI